MKHNRKNRNVKHSIKKQFAGIFISLMAGTILLCWFINSTFLESFYITNKQKALLEAYESINRAAAYGNITSEEFDIELQKICGRYNISMVVVDADARTVKASSHDSQMLVKQLMGNVWQEAKELEEQGKEQHPTWGYQQELYAAENYKIKMAIDPRTKTEYLEMWGVLRDGNLFLLRTAKEGIRESVSIANRFLAYIGIFAVTASGLIIWFVTRKVTEPILELVDISERMTHLDFDAKYNGSGGNNEISLLGEHINELSMVLEQTISELKSANHELTRDIQKKEEMDTMRTEFLSNVSHELKTPIALIQGYAEGLKEGISEDEESRDFYCDVIMDEAAKMNNMVKKLLTLNQLEFGNEMVEIERFDLTEMIRSCLQSGEILLKQQDISLKLDAAGPVYVWADEFRIEEVFLNYFSNAVNHCEGEKRIHVKLVRQDNKVRVSVFNTGLPIPEESVPHLWEKFYKVDKARTREYGGSGVGLSIVKAIMDTLDQKYGVINYENGVEFWFELATE